MEDNLYGYPIRDASENERAYILVRNKKTGNQYRIHGADNIIDGPNGPWKIHLKWLLLKSGLKYDGRPSSGEPMLYDSEEIHNSKPWEVIEVVLPYYPPNFRF